MPKLFSFPFLLQYALQKYNKINPFKSGRWRGGGIPLKSMSQKNLKMREPVKNCPVQCLQTARLQFLIIVVQYTVNTDSAFARH